MQNMWKLDPSICLHNMLHYLYAYMQIKTHCGLVRSVTSCIRMSWTKFGRMATYDPAIQQLKFCLKISLLCFYKCFCFCLYSLMGSSRTFAILFSAYKFFLLGENAICFVSTESIRDVKHHKMSFTNVLQVTKVLQMARSPGAVVHRAY